MKLKVLGHRVLIRPDKVKDVLEDLVSEELKKTGFKIALPEKEQKMEESGMGQGEILQVGSTAYQDFGGTPWVAVGDKVQFVRYAKRDVQDPETKEHLFVVNDVDILAVVED